MLNLNFQNGQAPALNARNMNAIVESINTLAYAVGGPNVASTVSEMTDASKVYVYTGSETGYTAGNWYYYNGSAWVSGGVYQATAVETDTTLTMPGVAADAKATGDVASDLKSGFRSRFNGRRISIIGDSIDTFDQSGYKIDGYRMYYPALDITKVEQTWWKQVIDNSGASLEVNASWSGSRVTDTHSDPTYPDFYDRVNLIGNPDVVFVTLGTNDSANGVSLGEYDYETNYTGLSESEFRPAYIKGVKALQEIYPKAEIVCIAQKMNKPYKDSIANIAVTLNCAFIDASDYVGRSGVHPGIKGMLQIASLVLYPTDKTLTQSHVPADSKEVGDTISELKSGVNQLFDLISDDEHIVFPDLINGSFLAPNNDHLVHTSNVRIVPNTKVKISVSKPVSQEGNYYAFGYHLMDEYGNVIKDRTITDTNYDQTGFIDSLPYNAYYISFDIGEYKSDNTYVMLRATSFSATDVSVETYCFDRASTLRGLEENQLEQIFGVGANAVSVSHGSYQNANGQTLTTNKAARTALFPMHGYTKKSSVMLVCVGYKVKAFRYALPDTNNTAVSTATSFDFTDWLDDYLFTELNETYNAIAFVFKKKDVSDTTDLTSGELADIQSKLRVYTYYENGTFFPPYRHRGLMEDGTVELNANRIVTIPFSVVPGNYYKVKINTNNDEIKFKFSVSFYDAASDSTTRLSCTYYDYGEGFFLVPDAASYARVLVSPEAETILKFEYLKSIEVSRVGPGPQNYFIDSSFAKSQVVLHNVGTLSGGKLTYGQAFCRYNNHWYSTDGSNIGVQSDDFSAVSSTPISLGHGNSMHTGELHKNYAYVSGWDNQKLYVVNLDSFVISETISLPTTGYTTCAVDDLNGLAYIFQRDDRPSTPDYYNFIVYDYVNESVISRRKISPAMAAMQSVDYVDGKIIVLCGLGTTVAPNGFYVFNTNGDVIGECVLGSVSANEPEGVCVDRVAKEIFISLSNRRLIKLLV